MSNIRSDISKCANDNCVMKTECRRYMVKAEDHQWYADFIPENNVKKYFNCLYFIAN